MNFDRVLEVVNKAKDIINKRGVESIRSSGRVFRQFPSYDGKDKVNIDDFIFGLRECGINLPKQDLDVILKFFEKDKDGMINFTEFLIALRGKPNDRRQAIIDKAFLKFDRKEWNDYYSAVSYSIDNDDHFVIMMKTTWGLD